MTAKRIHESPDKRDPWSFLEDMRAGRLHGAYPPVEDEPPAPPPPRKARPQIPTRSYLAADAARIVYAVCAVYAISPDVLRSESRRHPLPFARCAIAHLLSLRLGMPDQAIAPYVARDRSTVTYSRLGVRDWPSYDLWNWGQVQRAEELLSTPSPDVYAGALLSLNPQVCE